MIRFFRGIISFLSFGMILAFAHDARGVTIKNSCSTDIGFRVYSSPVGVQTSQLSCFRDMTNSPLTLVKKGSEVAWVYPKIYNPFQPTNTGPCSNQYELYSYDARGIYLLSPTTIKFDQTTNTIECKMNSSSNCQCQKTS